MKKILTLTILTAGFALAAGYIVKTPRHFPPVPIPADNPMSAIKVELGRKLFYDTRLSSDNTIACSSCHLQKFAFSDGGKALSAGVEGRLGTRNAPSLGNIGYRTSLFWEGGSPRLELQTIGPITSHLEMNMEPKQLVAKLKKIKEYPVLFKKNFDDGISMLNITKAISAFERTMISSNSAWDSYRLGNKTALSESAKRGLALFNTEKADCFHCHTGHNFTTEEVRNNGLYTVYEDIGLAKITDKDEDVGKFKVPSLRNAELTAPYMHDGSLKTLREVIEHYNSGGQPSLNSDPLIRPLGLSEADINDLIAFLKSLTDKTFTANPAYAAPKK